MAKTILTIMCVILVNVLVGCYGPDSGQSQLMPVSMKIASGVNLAGVNESDIIEQIAMNRKAYRNGLETLISYYNSVGDNMKLAWAKNEINALDDMPQYNYIIEAIVAGPNLKATNSIAEAELVYIEATRLQKKAERLVLIKHNDNLRLALDKYNQLIRKYPSSDRIDDAAYRSGGIAEHFQDYTIALLYYQRAYQWDSDTNLPARFKAACILDRRLARRDEALKLYKQALEKGTLKQSYRESAEMRISELTKISIGKE